MVPERARPERGAMGSEVGAVGDRFRGSRELIVSLPVFSSYAGTKQRTTSPFPVKCPRNPKPRKIINLGKS